jgi:Xaa-Pro aminopeptidase
LKLEYQPKRTFGQQGVDWMERINFERLRKERLRKLQRQMAERGLGAMLLLLEENVRYASGRYGGGWARPGYCIVPLKGDPVVFECVGDMDFVKMNCPWLKDRLKPALTYQSAPGGAYSWMLGRFVQQIKETLKEEGVSPKENLGVDAVDHATFKALSDAGMKPEGAMQAMWGARWIKTKDELELLKISASICNSAFYWARNKWVVPGVTEMEAEAKIVEFILSEGCDFSAGSVVASGGNTNPYNRVHATDKIIQPGDMVILDIASACSSYMGYSCDFVRCWPIGTKFTKEQKRVYRECYDYLQSATKQMRPGNTTADIARAFPDDHDVKYKTASLVNGAHSLGLGFYEGFWISKAFSLKYPIPIEENMFLAVETYAGKPGGQDGARLEQNGVITDTGYVPFSTFPFEEDALKGD